MSQTFDTLNGRAPHNPTADPCPACRDAPVAVLLVSLSTTLRVNGQLVGCPDLDLAAAGSLEPVAA